MEIISKNIALENYVFEGIKELLKNSSLTFSENDIYLYKDDNKNEIEKLLYDNVVYIEDIKNDNKIIIGCGFRFHNVLKFIAVNESYKGENLSDKIISSLTSEAFSNNIFDLFLYTKPQSVNFFLGLGFNLLIETNDIAMMENKKNKLDEWIGSIKKEITDEKLLKIANDKNSNISSIVMNANPMTKGHKFLIEKASKESDLLYVFILSNDVSMFKTIDRYNIVKNECSDFDNVIVIQGGNYIISPATFPTYFIKDKNIINEAQMSLDAEIFSKLIASKLYIKSRYVGTEPFSITTNAYNEILNKILPKYNVKLFIKERFSNISATTVRNLITEYKNCDNNDRKKEILNSTKELVTDTSFEIINNILK